LNLNILWLLITPLFFALGWFAGRIDMKTVINQAKQMPKKLYHAIDFLVEQKTGIASDNIKDVILKEPQLIELQISLGKLYRSRGENDIAIKTHNKILNSQFLINKEERENVILELAKDFHNAGLVDRAEHLLTKLIDSELYSHKAQELLLNIYQQDKNWHEAIDMANKLTSSDYSFHTEVAQFNCELALDAMIKSNLDLAKSYLDKALNTNKKCTRANMILGDVYKIENKHNEAIETWQNIEKQNYLYLPMIIEKILDSYIELNKIKEAMVLIDGYLTLYPNLTISKDLFIKLQKFIDNNKLLIFLRNSIKNKSGNPSELAYLILELNSNAAIFKNEFKQDTEIVMQLLNNYNTKLSRYKCRMCNFKAETFFWQCPACYEWESITPNSSEI
jgi:lipopolysaccharide biosynthesis regulator YciM